MGHTYNTLWSTEGGAPCPGGKHRLWINGFSLFRIFCVILYRPPICVISTGYHARLGINGSTGICDWDRRDWWNDPEDLRVHRTLLRRRSLEPSSRYDSDTPVGVPRNSLRSCINAIRAGICPAAPQSVTSSSVMEWCPKSAIGAISAIPSSPPARSLHPTRCGVPTSRDSSKQAMDITVIH